MKRLFALSLVIAMLFVVGCSKDDEKNETSKYQGHWEGTYDGGDRGTWSIDINAKGVVNGSTTSVDFKQTFDIGGTVTSEGVFKATVGSTTSGSVFTGKIDGNTASGTWANLSADLSGTWTGSKK